MGSGLWAFWRPAALLRVTGEDAATFLQGQFTNELSAGGNAAVYGLWLNVKGKVLADSFVLREGENEFQVCSYFSPAAVIRERLEAFIIADDVNVEDQTEAWDGLSFVGTGGEKLRTKLGLPAPTAGAFAAAAPGMVFRGRRVREGNIEWIFPRSAGKETLARVKAAAAEEGVPEAGPGDLECRRIRDGIPAVPADIGPNDLPNEGGLETDAISYTKGCYLGQEVMARLKSMGRVRRRLMRVAGGGEPPASLPAALFQGARKAGELRSAAGEGSGHAGLAMLALPQLDPAAGLSLAPDGPAAVKIAEVAP